MTIRNHPPAEPDIGSLKAHALDLRRKMMGMASGKGEGYIAQGLGIADCLAALYFHEMRHDPARPDWADRDRFLLSTGHYSIAMYAALAQAGYLDEDELSSYGLNGSALPMSTFDETNGVEIVGGSLGHGLGQAVGMAMGLRLDGSPARVFCEFSDGELDEGSTWESAMGAATFKCDNLVALIDCNGIQADGPVTVAIEPVADKMTAFGFETYEIDGNDMAALTAALGKCREPNGKPKAIVLRTIPGFGIPTLMARDRAHFVRVANDEWDSLIAELEQEHA
jgi:transketolase